MRLILSVTFVFCVGIFLQSSTLSKNVTPAYSITGKIYDSLKLKLFIEVPQKVFPKKETICITPMIGEFEFHPFWVQGLKSRSKHPIIDTDRGASIRYSDKISFYEPVDLTTIQFKITRYKGKKIIEDEILKMTVSTGVKDGYFINGETKIFEFSEITLTKF